MSMTEMVMMMPFVFFFILTISFLVVEDGILHIDTAAN